MRRFMMQNRNILYMVVPNAIYYEREKLRDIIGIDSEIVLIRPHSALQVSCS